MPNRIGGFLLPGSLGKPHVKQRCITTCQSAIALVYGMPRMAEKSVRNRSVS